MSEDDPKAENLITNIWKGRESAKCDGSMDGYSNLRHIIGAPAQKAEEGSTFFEVVSNFFDGLADDVDYLFQYKYRMASIETFFLKECLFGAVMLLFLYRVSNDYQVKFKGPLGYVKTEIGPDGIEKSTVTESNGAYDFASVTFTKQLTEDAERIAYYEETMTEFRGHYYSVMFCSISLIYAFFMKLLFKVCQKDRKE